VTKSTYDQTHKLDDYQFTRLRTEVNFGSREPVTEVVPGYDGTQLVGANVTYVPALFTYFREIIDNSFDEVVGKDHGSEIRISYDEATLTWEVEDDGRGIPSELVVDLLAESRSGRNFGSREELVGTNGVGSATVNYTSQFFEVDSRHNGVRHVQRFTEDLERNRHGIGKPTVTKCDRGDHGTKIRFSPSRHVYPTLLMPETFVRARVYELAAAYPKLKVYYQGSRIKLPGSKLDGGGIAPPGSMVIDCSGETTVVHSSARELGMKAGERTESKHRFTSVFYLSPNFANTKSDVVHSMVNSALALNGGEHVAAFRSEFYGAILPLLEKEAKRRKLKGVSRQDVEPGLLIYNVTKITAPNFDTQNKTKLISPDAGRAVKRAFTADPKILSSVMRNEKWIDEIMERCALRTHAKDLSDAEKESKKASKAKVAKLTDATGSDRSKCILLVTEGDSAVKGMMQVRDPRIHAGLPLRGKVMNVHGESASKVTSNAELAAVMSSIGLIVGQRAIPRSKLRYGQIWIATDEDEDGKNITALFVNFLYRFWPELFDPDLPPFVHRFETPLIIMEKKRGRETDRKYFYGRNYGEFDPNDFKGWSDPVRAKGLGRLEPPHWKDALTKPSLVPIVDNGDLKEALDLIFNGDRADDRKGWLSRDS
jgi:DNA gyrase/topoisomerase IV subunit B